MLEKLIELVDCKPSSLKFLPSHPFRVDPAL